MALSSGFVQSGFFAGLCLLWAPHLIALTHTATEALQTKYLKPQGKEKLLELSFGSLYVEDR